MTYHFEMNEVQTKDFFKKYVKKNSKPVLLLAIMTTVLTVIVAIITIFYTTELWLVIVGVSAAFNWLLYIIMQKGPKTQAPLYFKENNVDGIISVNYELCATDFIVSQPDKGNVNHYSYDIINRVVDLGEYAGVILSTQQCLPVLVTPETAPLIQTLKSCAKIQK